MSFIFKQPNGRYGRFSTICDCPSHINMTREDYVKVVMVLGLTREKAEEEVDDILAHHLYPFSECLDRFLDNNMSEETFSELCIKMNTYDNGTLTMEEL